ncbi:unnamed protein product [Pleuronectes platessa]|uniref:Cilium assembly protein DZIP1 domain-containing protein n=1 Tax=Pleuronectes platessa TaxID=8262 RepID=A0A9N7V8F8_PLEPL|nr:unnamed protein product [Pleuronectes platessa]
MVHDLKLNPSDKKEVRRELEQSAFKSLEELGVKPNLSGVKSKDFTFFMAKVNSLEDQAKEVPGYWRCRGDLDLSLDEKMSARMMTEAPPEPQAPSGQAVQGKESKTPQPAPRAESTTKPKMSSTNSKAAPRTCKVMKTGVRMAKWIRQTARKIRKSLSGPKRRSRIAPAQAAETQSPRGAVCPPSGTPATPRKQAVNSVDTPAADPAVSLSSHCELLQLIQQDLEVVTPREVMDSYYNHLEFIAEKGKRAPRLSLLLKHTVDARKRAGPTPH